MENRSNNSPADRSEKVYGDALYHLIMIRVHLDSISRNLAAHQNRNGPWLIHSVRQVQLDIRFTVEEIMLLSVAANKQAGEQITKAIRKAYKPKLIATQLAKLNPNFFPIAISVIETDEPGVDGRFIAREGDHLRADQAFDYWSKAGDTLHAKPEAISEENALKSLDQAKKFLALTVDLLETFEVDVSGKGMWIGGHLNYGETKGPALLYAPVIKD